MIAVFLGGVLTGMAMLHTLNSRAKSLTRSTDRDILYDTDLSFYYGDKKMLTNTEEHNMHLPDEFYKKYVHSCIVNTVDCVIVRVNTITNQKEFILVERKDQPAKGMFWFPGGRMFKGETFFAAALRKCRDETGINGRAAQVLGVYNTHFNSSAWDEPHIKGTQTVNVVVLIEVADGSEIQLDDTSSRFRWASVDPEKNEHEDQYIVAVLKRMHAWKRTFGGEDVVF
ncbi:hypothetical protein TrCOL_g4128 [Triparma columacea]|uniref:Nudix hydrolase domain-containing protein n=1 Tax=Triparma columacea TaxID=722753 RepID=A0A9W7GBI9_9STRA|nr:hypothetical protein TrCOL_g4128 [Triparma columacea]